MGLILKDIPYLWVSYGCLVVGILEKIEVDIIGLDSLHGILWKERIRKLIFVMEEKW